jgi:hypothetical protein
MGKRHEQTFHLRGLVMAGRHRKRCLTSLDIREIQIKTAMT